MALGLKTTVIGANVSADLGLTQSVSDDLDAAALAFGSDLMLRIDPRDVTRTTANPTGEKVVHFTGPNRDPLLFRNPASVSIGPVSGLYDGKDVFVLASAANAGEANDLAVYFNHMDSAVAFTVVGVAHVDAAMLGSGYHGLLVFRRDGSNLESALVHQYSGGVNYLSGFADQGGGGGANHNLDTSTVIAADTPFVFTWQVLSTGGTKLFINTDLATNIFAGVGSGVPETGTMKLLIGTTGIYNQQWLGGAGRTFVVRGDTLDTPERAGLTLALVAEMMSYHGVA